MTSALAAFWPALGERIAPRFARALPTPVERLSVLERELGSAPLYVKRDDRSAEAYGGNKVRTLEVLFGRARGALGELREIIAASAFGSECTPWRPCSTRERPAWFRALCSSHNRRHSRRSRTCG